MGSGQVLIMLCIFGAHLLVEGSGPAISSSSRAAGTGGDTDTTKTILLGRKLVLKCMLGEPEDFPQLKWYKDGEQLETNERISIHNNSSMVIKEAQMEDIGNYTCRSMSPPQSFDISVVYLNYKKMSKSATVFEGDKFSLNCEVEGTPHPSVQWFKDDQVLSDTGSNISHYELRTNDKGTPNALLFIEAAEYSDRGEFMCYISSQSIHLNTTSFIRVKDMYAALWPFLGICAEVIILCFIIFVYERNRIKSEVEESDTDQPTTDQKNSGGNKESVRHRK